MGDPGIHRTSHYTSKLNSQSPRMPQQPEVCVQCPRPSPVLVTVGCTHCRAGTLAFQLLLQHTTRWPNAPHTVDGAWLQCQQGSSPPRGVQPTTAANNNSQPSHMLGRRKLVKHQPKWGSSRQDVQLPHTGSTPRSPTNMVHTQNKEQ